MTHYTQQNTLTVFGEYDVVVAGGGTAGFAAALSAARNGAKTLIIERDACLGGMATSGLVSQFLGFVDSQDEENGIMGEILDKLASCNATTGVHWIRLDGFYQTKTAGYDAEILKYILDELLLKAGVDILFHTEVTDLCMDDDIITGLFFHNIEGCKLVKSKVFIDATFHGDIAIKAGCKWEIGRADDGAVQPGTLMFRMANIDLAKFNQLSKDEKREIAQRGVAEGKLYVSMLMSRPSFPAKSPAGTIVHLNQSRVRLDPLDARSLTKAEIEGRRQVQSIVDFYKRNVPGFENAFLVSTGAYLGQRDSRRIIGKYLLSKEDIMAGTKFPDAVVANSYPIDIHDPNGTGGTYFKPENGIYYIPYRCMVNDTVKNMIVTGRCISTTFEAHAGVRTMVPCVKLGEAAGMAAAMSIAIGKYVNDFDGANISSRLLGK